MFIDDNNSYDLKFFFCSFHFISFLNSVCVFLMIYLFNYLLKRRKNKQEMTSLISFYVSLLNGRRNRRM